MKKNTLYIGLNDKDSKQQKIATVEAYKIVTNILLANGIDGATIYEATGIYKHDDGQIVIENTLRVELIEADKNSLNEAIKQIKAVLNQDSIINQTEKITSELL